MKNSYRPDADSYPFQSRYFKVDGVNMHYIDEGEGPVILFVHGTPSWSFDFRNVIKSLRNQYRCIAADYVGFGLSDKPRQFDYSTASHAARLTALIKHLDLKQITLVGHDFGGPISWRAALDVPNRIEKIVLMNTWLRSSEGEKDFEKMKFILKSPLLPFLYRYLNFSPRFLMPQSFGNQKLDKETLKHYLLPFSCADERSGPLAFARSLLHDQQWFEELWQQREILNHAKKYIIWGEKDPVLKAHYLEKLMNSFPEAEVFNIEGCGHFPQEEAPKKVAEILRTLR